MRTQKPNWISVGILSTEAGLKEKYFCTTCGTICERIEFLNNSPKNCINEKKLNNFRDILSLVTENVKYAE